LTYIRKDGHRFPAIVSVTALRDVQGGIIGYLLIAPIIPPASRQKQPCLRLGASECDFQHANFSFIATDGRYHSIFNVGAERMLGYTAAEW